MNAMFQNNGIKLLNYTVFSLNYFIKMGNAHSNNSQTHVRKTNFVKTVKDI